MSIVVKHGYSFLVDSLYYGPPTMENDGKMSPEVKSFLEERSLDFATFEQIVAAGTRGLIPVVKRPFLPFPTQCYRGKIKQLKSSGKSGPGADIAVIEADVGESYPLKVEVERRHFYIYGHSMAKADLRHVIENGEYLKNYICYSVSLSVNLAPSFEKKSSCDFAYFRGGLLRVSALLGSRR